MKEFKDLTEDQQTLFSGLEEAILNKENEESVADILEKYEPKNKDSKNEDIEAVFTAFQENALTKQGRVTEKYTLSALAVKCNNVEALNHILNAVEKIDGLKKKILTQVQCKRFDGENFTLLNYAELYARSNHGSQNEQNAAEEIVKIIQSMNPVPEEQQNQDVSADASSATPQPSVEDKQNQDVDSGTSSTIPQPSVEDKQNQAAGAGALNAESNTKESNSLTQEQKRRLLSYQLDSAIATQKGVAGILAQYKSENEDSYAEDIEAVLTVFSPSRFTLLGSTVHYGNPKALEDILNAASKIPGLNKKILTNTQYKCKKSKSEITHYTLPEYIYNYRPNMIAIIEEKLKELGMPIPQKPQNQAAGHDNSPKSPSFLSQNKGKFAIIGAVALVGTIAAFMSGHPIIGIIVALTATFMLATDKGRGMCDKVGEKLYDALPECFKSQRVAYSGV